MSANQLRLLPAPQPLVERLGAGFFREVPRAPGIYRFLDSDGRLLYVGKSGNLHDRLASYRRTHGQSRKTIRLIHTASIVDWEVHPTELAACLRENELIRTHRPRFNRAGTWPRAARFVTVSDVSGGFRIDLTPEPALESYGAFRNQPAQALMALARLLSFAWLNTAHPIHLPRILLTREDLRHFVGAHASASSWLDDLRHWLAGDHDQLVARLIEGIPGPDLPFDRAFLSRQFEVLDDFHRRGPLRNRTLRAFLPPDRTTLAPEERDDLALILEPNPVPPLKWESIP